MSRSFRHTPMIGLTSAVSDKITKRQAHHRLRVAIRGALADERDMTSGRAFGDPCISLKEGKYLFNPKVHPELIRK